jgi:hypothetical protein
MFAALNSFQTGGGIPVNISEVFSTTLYTGNGSTQTINNGINLSSNGGLVWAKARSGTFATVDHLLQDSARGFGDSTGLASSTNSAQFSYSGLIQSVSSVGFTTGSNPYSNAASTDYVSWTFRKQPKFFDIVTYTGTGASNTISHNLGSTPGCIMFKRTDSTGSWFVYHNFDPSGYLILNSTAAFQTGPQIVSTVDATTFTLPNTANNTASATYVAYLFADDSGGFVGGNVISCGSYTGNGSAASGPIVTLGYEPQWLLTKRATGGTGNWAIFDSVRGIPTGSADAILYPNASDAEVSANAVDLLTNGFQIGSSASYINNSGDTYIYIAIKAN